MGKKPRGKIGFGPDTVESASELHLIAQVPIEDVVRAAGGVYVPKEKGASDAWSEEDGRIGVSSPGNRATYAVKKA